MTVDMQKSFQINLHNPKIIPNFALEKQPSKPL